MPERIEERRILREKRVNYYYNQQVAQGKGEKEANARLNGGVTIAQGVMKVQINRRRPSGVR